MRPVIYLITLVILIQNVSVNGECRWSLKTQFPSNTPIYYTDDKQQTLLIPQSPELVLTANQYITIACPGKGNTLAFTGKQEMKFMCSTGNKLKEGSKTYDINTLYCARSPATDIQVYNSGCGNSNIGKKMSLGFDNTKSNKHITLIEVCYDRIKDIVLYTRHLLRGNSLAGANSNRDRPEFKTKGLTQESEIKKSYLQIEQLPRFTALLGSKRANNVIKKDTLFLAKGHLAADADFIFETWASTSYYLVNAAPQWQTINGGNWRKVENRARNIAIAYQEDIVAYTGVHGVLQLLSDSNVLTDIYLLGNNKFPVPKLYWKVLYSERMKRGIAFVTSNNPFSSIDALCPDICSATEWNIPNARDISKGYTYCCDPNVLLAAIGNPLRLQMTGFITGIKPCFKPPCKLRRIGD